jgi:hypothetical protein
MLSGTPIENADAIFRECGIDAMDLYFERVANQFVLFPVVHHSYEFALAAQEAFLQLKPAAVALEYPAVLDDVIQKGIQRLPRVSILLYGNENRSYIRIEPVDAFVEAARTAIEAGITVRCVDGFAPDYPAIWEPVPDTYAVASLGHRRYCELLLNGMPEIRTEQDEARESAMAFHLQELARKIRGDILVLCGLSHLKGLRAQLQHAQPRPFEKTPPARLYHLSSRSLGEIMGTFPFISSVYELARKNIAADESDNADSSEPPEFSGKTPFQIYKGDKQDGLMDYAKRAHKRTAVTSKKDRRELLSRYIQECRQYYEVEIGDRLSPQQIFLLEHFARKYAAIKHSLLPDFYELLVAGRGCVNSHFCYRMWEIGTSYPPQLGASEIEIIDLRAEDLFALVNKVRMNPNAPLKSRAALPRFLRRKEKQRNAKKEDLQFNPFTICSHQPEDLIIEKYGSYLRSRGKNMLSEERKRVRPFETSLLDGIDLRETVRNWHTGQIYVQECMTIKGEISSLVVIFDEETSKYPHTMTWLGEHYQESDMAFYATDPEERQVGPGIRKAIYGGYLMTMPPGRLFDVFGDPAYAFTLNYAERLLLAAIDYSIEKFVIYAAPKPPRPAFQTLAGRYGKRILYIPLSQLSPVMLQRIRSFHILSNKNVRDYASDYIF